MKQRQFKRIKYATMKITPYHGLPHIKMRQRRIRQAKLKFYPMPITPGMAAALDNVNYADLELRAHVERLMEPKLGYSRAIAEHSNTVWAWKGDPPEFGPRGPVPLSSGDPFRNYKE